nr:uncharacterized protein LOC112024543 [Quercus suber]
MEVGASKKNKRVQEAAAFVAAVIKEGKFQLPKPGEKRKFDVDTSQKPFGTITHPKETPTYPSVIPGRLASVEHPRAPGRGKGPFTPPKPPLLVNDDTYAMERVISIIKEDINDCEYALTAIGESGLHNLAKAMVRIKTPELRCKDYEDQVVNLWKCVKGNNEVIKELQGSITPLTKKGALLEGKVKELEDRCFS